MTHKEHLKQLLAKGKIAEAIKELLEATKLNGQEDLNDAFTALSGRFHRNEDQKAEGTISTEHYDLAWARIKQGILHYLSEYEEDGSFQWQKEAAHSKKMLIDEDDTHLTPNTMNTNLIEYKNGYALLIGLSYKHWNRERYLKGTLNDINDLAKHFLDGNKAAYIRDNVKVLTEDKATAENIYSALDELAEKVQNDPQASVLIYYSGHGETDGTNHFLVPYDFALQQWSANRTFDPKKVVLSKEFTKKLDSIKASKCLVILDCCHAESMPTDRSLDSNPDFIENFTKDINFTQNINLNIADAVIATDRSVGSQIAKGKGRVILTSCQGEEKSLDIGTNGLFTKVLLECLEGKENLKKDGWVRLIDLINYVPSNVASEALTYKDKYGNPRQQHPVFKSIEGLGSEDFIICAYDIVRGKEPTYDKNVPEMEKTSTFVANPYHKLIKKCEDEIVLKELEKLTHEQEGKFVLAQNCQDRIDYLNKKIADFKGK